MIGRWLTINILTVIIIVLWSLYQGYDSNYILIGKIVAQMAFFLFLININMYFVFLLIRRSKIRNVKVKFAKISKKMMKYHIPIAITASLLIIFHAAVMLYIRLEHLWGAKIISGTVTTCTLIILLFSGLLRRWKASGKRRKFHYIMAFMFLGFTLFHIFL
ncbi:hypothetical protein JMM81_12735 [Bacillus sp. V3B]|uniref:hypothetical protein n=1 Tax=Bacillus sp. V3B TaxID=2804915 RepID=UPI00210EE384|nr:hypothetical protein [Bacillus sp. V3B]MCQ6275818.1 hypothetical protein [Bacillus sp. V3B]